VERSWGVLGGGGVLRSHYTNGYHGPGFPGGISFVVCSAHFFPIFSKWVLHLCTNLIIVN